MSRFSRFLKLFRFHFALILLCIITILSFIPFFTYLYFAKDLSSKERLMNRNNTGLILLDKNEKPFFTFFDARYKEFVPLDRIPKHLQQAVISAEDKEFYSHPGFSLRGIIRSILLNLENKKSVFGGSTITQQLVKNLLLTSKKSYLRKYQEIVLAQEIERRYTKNEILEMYLNSVYFGEGAFGIEQAAQIYFGKKTKDLSLSEAAMLAGIIQAPSEYTPIHARIKAVKKREEYVLNAMRNLGYISQKQKDQIIHQPIRLAARKEDINSVGIHFALMVRDALIKEYGEEEISRSGFKVKTTLDLDLQKFAEEEVKKQVLALQNNHVTNGAAVVIDPKTGAVKALVGSVNWYDTSFGKVNMATIPRSPGSSFKPIIYAAALEERLITPATPLRDVASVFQRTYRPQNYDRTFRGTVLVRRALANSLNVPSVEVMEKVGIPAGLEMAKRLGITSLKDPSDYGLSLVLGTGEVSLLEMTNAYSTFANNGTKHPISTVLQITDKEGKTIFKKKNIAEEVLEQEVAFLISSILSDTQARMEVFGNTLTISRPAAVKTGTAEDYKDALTIGYTPSIAVGVWVGNNDNTPMDSVAGSLGAAPIWKSLMEHITAHSPVESFTPPDGITQRSVCSYNGLLAKAGMSGKTEYFIAGTEPSRVCYIPKPTVVPQTIQIFEEKEEKKDEDSKTWKKIGGPPEDAMRDTQQQVKQKIEKHIEEQLQRIQNNSQSSLQITP